MDGSLTLSELGLTAAVNRPQNPGSFVAAWTDEEVTATRLSIIRHFLYRWR